MPRQHRLHPHLQRFKPLGRKVEVGAKIHVFIFATDWVLKLAARSTKHLPADRTSITQVTGVIDLNSATTKLFLRNATYTTSDPASAPSNRSLARCRAAAIAGPPLHEILMKNPRTDSPSALLHLLRARRPERRRFGGVQPSPTNFTERTGPRH